MRQCIKVHKVSVRTELNMVIVLGKKLFLNLEVSCLEAAVSFLYLVKSGRVDRRGEWGLLQIYL